jgi:hypothetical protein
MKEEYPDSAAHSLALEVATGPQEVGGGAKDREGVYNVVEKILKRRNKLSWHRVGAVFYRLTVEKIVSQ